MPVVPSDPVVPSGITAEQLAEVRAWVGATPADEEIGATWDRLGSVEAVALEILRGRYADFLADPLKWSVEGDFSLDGSANIKELRVAIDELASLVRPQPSLQVTTITRADPWR